MRTLNGILLALALSFPGWASALESTFSFSEGQLRISSVSVGDRTFVGVRLRHLGSLRFALDAAIEEVPALTAPYARYDTVTGLLTIPAVRVDGAQYVDVSLQAASDGSFSVVGANGGPPPTLISAPPRWVEVWSSANLNSGELLLDIANPASPSLLKRVTSFPPTQRPTGLLRVRGGTFDPASGTIERPGTRHLVYLLNGQIFRVSLDQTEGSVSPQRVSSETQASDLELISKTPSGSNALLRYRSGANQRFVFLSFGPDQMPLSTPQFPGDPEPARYIVHCFAESTNDTFSHCVWNGRSADRKTRLFRTDANFGAPTSIGTFGSGTANGLGRLRLTDEPRTFYFVEGSSLLRYDNSTSSVRTVFEGLTSAGSDQIDDDSLFIRVDLASGPALLRCVDQDGGRCGVLASGPDLFPAGADRQMSQVRDFILLRTRGSEEVLAIHKSNGLRSLRIVPETVIAQSSGVSRSNRKFFSRQSDGRLLIGTVDIETGQRTEHEAEEVGYRSLADRTAPNRVLTFLEAIAPVQRVLVRLPAPPPSPRPLVWLNLETGDLGPTLEMIPGLAAGSLYDRTIGTEDSIGRSLNGALDGYLVSTQTGSLRRLTFHVRD